jgi:hypothetical protein
LPNKNTRAAVNCTKKHALLSFILLTAINCAVLSVSRQLPQFGSDTIESVAPGSGSTGEIYGMSTDLGSFDVQEYRVTIRKWTDEKLIAEGRSCKLLCDRSTPPEKRLQKLLESRVEELRAELNRRHPDGLEIELL